MGGITDDCTLHSTQVKMKYSALRDKELLKRARSQGAKQTYYSPKENVIYKHTQ